LIFDNELLFVYEDNDETIEKLIPVKDLGPHLSFTKFKDIEDENGSIIKKTGGAYAVNEKVIFNYIPRNN
jgi:tRNA A58 N-methylase Trm61